MTGSHTRTVTVKPAYVQTGRVHDYLYDKDFHVSGPRDHNRETFRAKTNSENVKQQFKFKTMFSELRHHPRYETVFQQTDPVPGFINRNWSDRTQLPREESNVGGSDRYKYFRRPVVPYSQAPVDVILEPQKPQIIEEEDTGTHRTIETQTDYRDQESQTDPYSPEFRVKPGETPEILTLAALKHTQGLPAGLAEVKMIEHAREKRKWEESLPPLSDPEQFKKRRQMMEEREKYEWQLREEQIKEIQNARLEVLKEMLQEREEKQNTIIQHRVDKTLEIEEKQADEKINKIRKAHIMAVRQMGADRVKLDDRIQHKPRDILSDYTQYDSEVYAPIARHGVFPDRGSEQFNVKSKYLDTYEGLCKLESSLGKLTETRVVQPKAKIGPDRNGFVRRTERQEWDLKEVHEQLKKERREKEEPVKKRIPSLLKEVPKPVPRPETPTSFAHPEEYQRKQVAATVLQKLLRGAASRTRTLYELSRRLDLVKEVRSTHILLESERAEKEAEKMAVLDQRLAEKNARIEQAQVSELVQSVAGNRLAKLLDFLSSELVRLQDERRCHAFTMMAERKRRLREAKEAGLRQEEERRRREEDEIWREVLKTRQSSVDNFLLKIATEATHNAAAELAEAEVEELAEKIDLMDAGMTSMEQASKIVHQFLIPEVIKREKAAKFHQTREALLLAAQSLLFDSEEKDSEEPKSEEPEQ